ERQRGEPPRGGAGRRRRRARQAGKVTAAPQAMSEGAFRTGTVAIVGRAHVAITSRKPQTTRHRLLGIHTDERTQLLFVDTPGFQTRHGNALNRTMNRTVGQVAREVDAVLLVVDAHGWDERDDPVLALLPAKAPVVLALNKVDKVRDKQSVAATLLE